MSEEKTVSAKPKVKLPEFNLEQVYRLPDGSEVTLKEIIEHEAQEKLAKLRKRGAIGKRYQAIREFCIAMYKAGSVARTLKQLQKFAEIARNKVGVKFTFRLPMKKGYVWKVPHEVEDKSTGKTVKVTLYALSTKALEEFELKKIPVESTEAPAEAKEETPETEATETETTEETAETPEVSVEAESEAEEAEETEDIEKEIEAEIEA